MFKSLCLAAILVGGLALATQSHQGSTDEDPSKDGVDAGGGAAGLLLESTRKGKSGDDGGGAGPKKGKGAADKDDSRVRVTGYPLFIFAEGPPEAHAPVSAIFVSRTKQMIAEVNRKIPGARIVTVSPFSSASLAEVWRKARREKNIETSLITASLLVIQARGGSGGEGLTLMGEEGPEAEAKWKAAIGALSESIYGGLPKISGGGKLETVLLTAGAGALDCKHVPGPFFGASPDAQPFSEEGMKFWLDWQREHRQDLFPVSARDWFDSWNITDKITRRKYFYCPMASPRGYLGNKQKDDEIRGGW